MESNGQTPAPLVAVYLEGIAAQRRGGVPAEIRVSSGATVTHILQRGEAAHADLIVLVTYGRTGLPRLRLGSGATKFAQGSAGPVLLAQV